jgi:acetyltransferase
MTIRNLDRAFTPASVALIGASERPGSLGALVLANILSGGFEGPVYAVNPKYRSLSGLACYASVKDLPGVPDLCVIATPPSTIPGILDDIGQSGGRAAVIITAGLGEKDNLKQRMLEAAGRHGLRIIGPNTIGILAPRLGLNASFSHLRARPGSLALLSQSGAIVSSIIDWAEAEGIGFSQIVSLGDMADVDVGDCLNMLARDPNTSAILMYLESIPDGRKFMSAARSAARLKPVIAVKPGRHAEAARAAQTHTGALAGADAVVDAALRRAGIIRVNDLEDLFSAAEITARFKPLESARVAIVTNGGGAGVLAVDHLLDQNCLLAELSPDTIARLDEVLPPTWSRANPVDIIGDAPPERYVEAVKAVAADANVDALLVMNCPTALAEPLAAARALGAAVEKGHINGKPVLATWLGEFAATPARQALNAAGIASLDTPAKAAEGLKLLMRWRQLGVQLQRVPETYETLHVDRGAAERAIAPAMAAARSMLTEIEAKAVLSAYGIAVPRTILATDAAAVRAAAADLLKDGGRLAVKMVSATLTHKSDLGGVILDIDSEDGAAEAAATIMARLEQKNLQDQLDGFAVQQMVRRPGAQELLIGIASDPVFGPVLMFGAGGTAVEVLADTTMELLPVDDVLAEDMIGRTRISRLLAGFRDRPAADKRSIVQALKAVSQLLIDVPQITALDINPLLADHAGVIALDARIEIDTARGNVAAPNPALVIRPYPSGWKSVLTANGQDYDVRPIRPVDAALYPKFLARVTPEDMRQRFLTSYSALSEETLVRLTQLDYDRDIAFVALDRPNGDLAAIIRYAADPDRRQAEFGLLVRSDLRGNGLGAGLMKRLIEYASAQGIAELFGVVLRDNRRMLDLCLRLGFSLDETVAASDPAMVRLRVPGSVRPPQEPAGPAL